MADGKDHETPVSGETLAAAIRIGQYLLCQAEYVFDAIGGSPVIAQAHSIVAKIRRHNFYQGKRHELYALCRSRQFASAKDMQPALELLEEHGYIRMEEGYYGGVGRKPDVDIVVNPVLFLRK